MSFVRSFPNSIKLLYKRLPIKRPLLDLGELEQSFGFNVLGVHKLPLKPARCLTLSVTHFCNMTRVQRGLSGSLLDRLERPEKFISVF